jgi:hypothetical protein
LAFVLLLTGSDGSERWPERETRFRSLDPTRHSLRAERPEYLRSPWGEVRITRYRHFFHGHEVLGSGVVETQSKRGSDLLDALALFDLDPVPRVSPEHAVELALLAAPPGSSRVRTSAEAPESLAAALPALKVLPDWKNSRGRAASLGYEVTLELPPRKTALGRRPKESPLRTAKGRVAHYWVDAHSGNVRETHSKWARSAGATADQKSPAETLLGARALGRAFERVSREKSASSGPGAVSLGNKRRSRREVHARREERFVSNRQEKRHQERRRDEIRSDEIRSDEKRREERRKAAHDEARTLLRLAEEGFGLPGRDWSAESASMALLASCGHLFGSESVRCGAVARALSERQAFFGALPQAPERVLVAGTLPFRPVGFAW